MFFKSMDRGETVRLGKVYFALLGTERKCDPVMTEQLKFQRSGTSLHRCVVCYLGGSKMRFSFTSHEMLLGMLSSTYSSKFCFMVPNVVLTWYLSLSSYS